MVRAPKACSMLVVMAKASPSASTMEIWLVPFRFARAVVARRRLAWCWAARPAVTRSSARWVDQSAALGEIVRIEQPADGDGNEVGVGEVERAVGESEPFGLGDEMGGPGAEGGGAEIVRLDQSQHLAGGDAARGGRTHAADPMKPVGHADRLALYRAIAGEILGHEAARLARIVLHRVGDVAGDVAS